MNGSWATGSSRWGISVVSGVVIEALYGISTGLTRVAEARSAR